MTRQKKRLKPSAKQTPRGKGNRQGSPIIIGGGGSVGIDFSAAYYQQIPNTDKFQNLSDSADQIWVIDKYGSLVNATPFKDSGWVDIHCFDSGGTKSGIRIYCKPLAIEFDTVEFPMKTPNKKKIRYCDKRSIGKNILVWDEAGATAPRIIDAGDGKCTIVVVNKL